jgi:hypothetical protein
MIHTYNVYVQKTQPVALKAQKVQKFIYVAQNANASSTVCAGL